MTYPKCIITAAAFLMACLIIFSCGGDNVRKDFTPPLPYPDTEEALYIQGRIDSSEYLWFTEIKPAVSSFMNEFEYSSDGVSTSSIRILGEGIFHGTVEAELPDKILTLTMERPFKQKGKNSLWQVIKVEERPWREQKSR
ncbi:MAG: hypothetical protein V3W18_06300 [candidate division Zixibacteria bacterium]